MRRPLFFLFPVLFLGLVQCTSSTSQSDFDCPVMQGEACQTIEDADARAEGQDTPSSNTLDLSPEDFPAASSADPSPSTESPSRLTPTRQREVIARVWFFPFVDTQGAWHEGHYIRVPVQAPRWEVP